MKIFHFTKMVVIFFILSAAFRSLPTLDAVEDLVLATAAFFSLVWTKIIIVTGHAEDIRNTQKG